MQIIIDENEIMDALNAYCAKQVVIPEGKTIKVDFTVGRGGNGTRATIDFVNAGDKDETAKETSAIPEGPIKRNIEESPIEGPIKEESTPVFEKEEPSTEEKPTETEEASNTEEDVSSDSLFNH